MNDAVAAHDPVDHPAHYQGADGIEAIDVIERYDLGYHLGNAFKYLVRAGKKSPDALTDLQKARWYLRRWAIAGALEPIADEEALPWATPETIAGSFELAGFVSEAAIEILSVAAFADDESDEVRIGRAGNLLDAAIALLAPNTEIEGEASEQGE